MDTGNWSNFFFFMNNAAACDAHVGSPIRGRKAALDRAASGLHTCIDLSSSFLQFAA